MMTYDKDAEMISYLIEEECGAYIVRRTKEESKGESVLVQVDWDFPGLAARLGWSPSRASGRACCSQQTDGTISCPVCGTDAAVYIRDAARWIDEHLGIPLSGDSFGGLDDYFEEVTR